VVKRDCAVLDFGISLLNHGDLEADVRLRYDRGTDFQGRTKNCPQCSAELPVQARECLLCGYAFKVRIDQEGSYNELAEFRLVEIELIKSSPFKWVSIFPSEKVLITTGFASWAAVVSPDGENWFAIGGGPGLETLTLTVANKIGAISSADDFMRAHESSSSAKKAARWMGDPASLKQLQLLEKFGYDGLRVSKIDAAAHLTFRLNRRRIEKLIGISA
jgi:hypothetical protein